MFRNVRIKIFTKRGIDDAFHHEKDNGQEGSDDQNSELGALRVLLRKYMQGDDMHNEEPPGYVMPAQAGIQTHLHLDTVFQR
jgi:hypothetical protein